MKERIFDWIGGSGIVFSLLLAIGVAVNPFLHPVPGFPGSPSDIRWAILYAGLFILTLALFRWKFGNWLLVIVASAAALLLIIPLFSPDTRWSILAWFVLSYLFASLGAQVLSWFFPITGLPLLDRWLLSLASGMGVMALLTLGLGVVRLYYSWLAWAIIILLLALSWNTGRRLLVLPTLRCLPLSLRTPPGLERRWLALGFGFLFIALFSSYIWALTPAIRYDALSYHLAAPAIYLRNHGIVEISESFNTYWAHYADMLYTLAMLLTGQPLPGLLHFSAGLASAGFVFALTRRVASTHAAWIATILFCYIPVVTVQAGTAYIDLFTTLFVVAAVYVAVSWYQTTLRFDREAIRWLALCGGLAGLAIGVKLAALPLILPFGVLLGFGILRSYGWRKAAQGLFCWGLPVGLFVLPWLLRDWLWTGNPIYPLMANFFQGSQPVAQSNLFAILPARGGSIVDYLILPWSLTVNAARYYHESPGGALAAIPLLALPWSYWRSRSTRLQNGNRQADSRKANQRWLELLLWAACLLGIILTFFSAPNIRYLFPILTILSSLAALNIDRFLPKINTWGKLPAILLLGLAVVYLFSTRLTTLRHIPQYLPRIPISVGLGFADRQKFLSDHIAAYNALQFLGEQDPAPKVLSLGNEFRLYTTARIYGTIFSNEARQILAGNPDAVTLSQRLAQAGFDYILINESEMSTSPLYAPGKAVNGDFLRRYTRLEYTNNQVDIYRFYPQGVDRSVPPVNLLINPGFEDSLDQKKPDGWEISGSPVYDTSGTEAYNGVAAVRVHGPQTGDTHDPEETYSFLSQTVPVNPGQVYTAAARVRPVSKPPGSVALQVSWVDAKGQVIDADGVWKPLADGWGRYQMHIQAPTGATSARFFLLMAGDQAAWFDDVCFAPGDDCP